MNKNDNLRLIMSCGDDIQLEFGNEFGYYAKHITNDQLYKFCNEANINELVKKSGFMFTAYENKETNKMSIFAVNRDYGLSIPLKLLDNSLYFVANDNEWRLIDEDMFNAVQKIWRNFIAKHIWEYKKNLNMLDALDRSEPCFSF